MEIVLFFKSRAAIPALCQKIQFSVINREFVLNGMKLIEVDEGTFEKEHQELVYTCSMHPQIIRNEPGNPHLWNDFGQKSNRKAACRKPFNRALIATYR
jgi:hypothetical protein